MIRVGILLFEEVQALDVTGPLDALDSANQWLAGQKRPSAFEVFTIGFPNKSIKTESNLNIVADCTINSSNKLDWLIIPGGAGVRQWNSHTGLIKWLEKACIKSDKVISICTGAYLLAATGLLDGHKCCSHWRFIDDLKVKFPGVHWDANPLYLQEGKFFTSGGLTAGIDLTLYLIEQTLGLQAAQYVAKDLVVPLRRSGDQSQFSSSLALQSVDSRMATLQSWLSKNLSSPITVDDMANQLAISERHFRRLFAKHMKMTPKEFLDQFRLEHSKDLLLASSMSIELIAQQVGYKSSDSFRRAFKNRYSVSPGDYRERFK